MRFWKNAQAKFSGLGKRASDSSQNASKSLDRYFFNRLDKIAKIQKFVLVWVLVLVFLIAGVLVQNYSLNSYYQSEQPVAGGLYNEGMVGSFTNANPVYAVQPADKAVSRLIFAGLVKYDNNNQLVGDLAESWTVDESGEVYSVKLRPNLVWQDGQPLTATDVEFTYRLIQDPEAGSPLRSSWTGIKVTALDERTVQFKLPSPLSPFPHSLTVGIIPQHLLSKIPAVNLRSSNFNTENPLGAGPFRLQSIALESAAQQANAKISLEPFEDYWAGRPKLRVFVLHAYSTEEAMLTHFRDDQLNAIAGLDTVPADVANDPSTTIKSFNLTAANMVFFKTSEGALGDKTVRRALVLASQPDKIINQLDYEAPRVDEPFLKSGFAYNPNFAQVTDKPEEARQLLEKAGWSKPESGPRHKGSKKLQFNLVAPDTPASQMITAQLKDQWKAVGVEMQAELMSDESFHKSLIQHDYDAVLYGVTVGADPDVFVYWHSSQVEPGSSQLNLSEYDSSQADQSLSAGRTRFGENLRKAKYQQFLETWQRDVPALGLYQPRFVYVVNGPLYGLNEHAINSAADRYFNVSDWAIRTAMVTNDN